MHNYKKFLTLLPISLLVAGALAGCDDKKSEKRVIRILNCEDYIYEYEEGDEENATEGYSYYTEDVMDQFVEYWAETHDGEEIEYVYDTFDTNETMFNELKTGKTTYDVIVPSDYMIQKLISNNMLHPLSEGNRLVVDEEEEKDVRDNIWRSISPFLQRKFYNITDSVLGNKISDYAVPYMWGTVGMMYNPAYYMEKNPELTEDDVHELFSDWDNLYTNENLKDSFSIKDSVRDTYAVSLVHTYRDEIAQVSNNKELTDIFNRHDAQNIAEVKADMLKLKDKAFGFECDSGKTDMVDQKVGANMCWSGDATWAIEEARSENEDQNVDLYYSIPTSYNGEENKGASNIWFDGLCMPENKNSDEKQYELAEGFIEFMSTPEIAVQNCYCVGYTPGVAGDAMLEYMRDCYDIEEDLPSDCHIGEDYVIYDLSYFFNGSLDELDEEDAILYADPDDARRELAAQYPQASILDRLAVMNDFGAEGNQALLDMWEQVRTNPLPTWAIILFVTETVAALGFAAYLISKKITRKNLKKVR